MAIQYLQTNLISLIHTEVISRAHDLSGTKVIARLASGQGGASAGRFRARIVRDMHSEQCVATVSCWSNNAWSLIESIDISMLPIFKFHRQNLENDDWAMAMDKSLDMLLQLGLDIVP